MDDCGSSSIKESWVFGSANPSGKAVASKWSSAGDAMVPLSSVVQKPTHRKRGHKNQDVFDSLKMQYIQDILDKKEPEWRPTKTGGYSF